VNKRLFAVVSGLVLTVLVFSTALAGGGVKLSGVSFSLGSLISKGYVSGIGNTDIKMVLDASGIPAITCINGGGNQVPGQSSPKVNAEGVQVLPGNDPLRKNGKAAYNVEAKPSTTILSWDVAGCPNSNWYGVITFVYWTNATITVFDAVTGAQLLQQNYVCNTTKTSVSCTPVP
jgi:hypothetical protein